VLEDFAGAHVLIVDDVESNLVLLQRLLTRRGLRNVHVETDPERAVAELDTIRPDIVLLDIHMPRLDGHAVLAHLRRWAAGAYLPVVVLTADTTTETLERALDLGATDFLTKPFNATEIVLRMRNLLQTRELYSTLRQHLQDADTRLAGLRADDEQATRHTRHVQARVEEVLAAGGPRMVFQPVVDLRDASVAGFEALARFSVAPHDPVAWFRDAESVGLGIELELAAVRGALAGAGALPGAGAQPEHAFLAVNVSAATLLSGALDDVVADHDGARRLVVELTEHLPISDYDALLAAFAPLARSGALLAVDDTGAGYAGLRHLLHLRPDVIKLDLSLVTGIDTDPVRRALAAALLAFARDVDARVIAEGVETPAQADALAGLGVSWVQGWLYGRPV